MAGFFQDMFADAGFKGFTGNQINFAAKKLFQPLFKPQKSDKPNWFGKLNENIDITIGALFTPGERPKHSHIGNRMLLLQLRQMLVEEISDLFAGFSRLCSQQANERDGGGIQNIEF